FANPVAVAVIVGLMLGKPLGITLFSWLAVRTGLSRRPADISWGALAAGGVLAGIRLPMSPFLTGVSLQESLTGAAKVGILSASTLCAVVGTGLLLWLLPRPSQSRVTRDPETSRDQRNGREPPTARRSMVRLLPRPRGSYSRWHKPRSWTSRKP